MQNGAIFGARFELKLYPGIPTFRVMFEQFVHLDRIFLRCFILVPWVAFAHRYTQRRRQVFRLGRNLT